MSAETLAMGLDFDHRTTAMKRSKVVYQDWELEPLLLPFEIVSARLKTLFDAAGGARNGSCGFRQDYQH